MDNITPRKTAPPKPDVDAIVAHLLSAPHIVVERRSRWTIAITNECHSASTVLIPVEAVDALIGKLHAARLVHVDA